MKIVLAIAIFTLTATVSIAQVSTTSVDEWVKKLSDPDDKKNENCFVLIDSLSVATDTTWFRQLVQQLAEKANGENIYFNTRLNVVKIGLLTLKDFRNANDASKEQVLELNRQTMQLANESNDEYLAVFASRSFFSSAFRYNELELAVMHAIYSIELFEKLFGINSFPQYQFAGELMYRVKEYEKCKEYTLKWLALTADTKKQSVKDYRMRSYNTVALAYHRNGNLDSALYYYNIALNAAKLVSPDFGWKGIISGNMGQVFYLLKQYDTAISLLANDYQSSLRYQYFDNAANSLQWEARAQLASGNKEKALQQVRQAMAFIRKMPDEGYQRNIYFAAVDIYRANGMADSAVYYSVLYQQLHDRIEKKINTSSIAISGLRLNEEKNKNNIRQLQQEKKSQQQQRNFILLGIVLLTAISILLINRQRIQFKLRQANLEQEKKLMETEMAAARQQMNMFTQNIVEKTSLIEKLEQQMQKSSASSSEQESISTLSNLTILTEEDWAKFKTLFEKINPLFFQKLKATAPDITVAEQRMAALTRLQLTTREMASMQGISPDSVHKTRQRLRQRLGVSNDINLEEFFTGL